MDASKLVSEYRVVPVVVAHSAAVAVPLAEALLEAGLGVIEVTLRTDDAIDVIESIAAHVPEMIVGAGSLRRPEQFAQVKAAGATFGVSPGSSDTLVKAAFENELPFIPGAATASEMIQLYEQGYLLQKFFPAELAGGAAYLKSVGAPLPEITFMPTGGVTPENAADYLSLKNVACVGGSWITPLALQQAGDFNAIAKIAKDAATLSV